MKPVRVDKDFELNELIEFSQSKPWKPTYSRALVKRFLTDLISDEQFVLDLHDERGRVASAVLLDKVTNPANDACLEILGVRANVDEADVFRIIISWAKHLTPLYRSGFQLELPDCETAELSAASLSSNTDLSAFRPYFLSSLGLMLSYNVYEMRVDLLGTAPASVEVGTAPASANVADAAENSTPSEIVQAEVRDADLVYELLRRTFADNPETSIPESSAWKDQFLKASSAFLWKSGDDVLGFAYMAEPVDCDIEIRLIGVIPESRGLGIGFKLLNHCLNHARYLKSQTCHLNVAASNPAALNIYLRSGFTIVEKTACYRMDVAREF